MEDDLAAASAANEGRERDLAFAIDNLQRLEQFAGDQMRQPVIDRLNQWVQHERIPSDWEVDPALAGLPEPLGQLAEVRSLDKLLFLPYDGYALQEAIWLRDVSNWARGRQIDDLARAENLFDWVVRNIQLTPGTGRELDHLAQYPWETLLWGKGTAVDRAWVFILLLRQQGIDAVVLALPDPADPSGEKRVPWAVGVLKENEFYLFDPALGLPIPGPQGVKYEGNRLIIPPATLSALAKAPALLRKLDLPGHPYPVDASRLAGVAALVEASPAYLEARMKLVESQLVGDQHVVLTTSPSALIARLGEVAHLADRRLWTWPYEVLARRGQLTDEQREQIRMAMLPFEVRRDTPLWKGRVLHLKGVFTGFHNATYYYQRARPSKRALAAMKRRIAEEENRQRVPEMRERLEAQVRGKGDATYWLGLIAIVEGRPKAAFEYFTMRTWIKPWTQGAIYNLGRIVEDSGNPKEAAEIYRNAPPSPDSHGNLLRARWLDPAGATETRAKR